MSVPCVGATKEAKEKQDAISTQDDIPKNAIGENSQTSCSKDESSTEKADNTGTMKRKLKRSADSVYDESSTEKADNTGTMKRKLKRSADSVYNSNMPSDLSTGSSREEEEAPKPEACSDNTALVAVHYNTLEEKSLSVRNQSRILYMRNFNNWVKSTLINEFLSKVMQDKTHGASLKVMDMCCGKGGDLLKWRKSSVTHVIFTDIAEVSVEQCQHRYNEMLNRSSNDRGFAPLFTAEFITADCTKVRLREKFKDPSMHLDFVSCQFAFHYSFETLQQAECMIRNASECLRPGGYFIGTIPDAYDLVSRWQKCDGNKYGNEIFNVEFLCEDKTKPPIFGAKYNFHLEGVVDCPEFLVHFPTLCKLALKFGLELVLFERFDEYYTRMKNEGRSLLGKIQALETYPPVHGVPLLGHPAQDYQHAIQYMQNLPGHRKIGTLSQAEWDATSLYAVFAFQKMKTSWNSEGKAEYVKL